MRHVQSDYRPLFILAAETGFRIDDVLKIRQWQASKSVLTLREEKDGKDAERFIKRSRKRGDKTTAGNVRGGWLSSVFVPDEDKPIGTKAA